jgi:hypothetical protein
MEAVWNRGTMTRVAPGDDEGNPSWVGPRILLASVQEQLEAGVQGGYLGRGVVRQLLVVTTMGDTQRSSSPASPRAGSLEPATSVSRTDPWPSTLDLGTRKERGALDNNNQRENVMGEGATWVWRKGGREGDGRKVGAQAVTAGKP